MSPPTNHHYPSEWISAERVGLESHVGHPVRPPGSWCGTCNARGFGCLRQPTFW